VANQLQYSILWRALERETAVRCGEVGIGILAWAPLAHGVLTGKGQTGSADPEGSRGADRFGRQYVDRYASASVLARVARLAEIAKDLGLTTAQLSLAWVLSRPGVACAIAGGSTPEQILENAGAAELELDNEVVKAIDEAVDGLVEWDPIKVGHPEQVMPEWRRTQPMSAT
jgi:aryl-alcohol dehydrogenase-like predicted oxidoreductase